MSKTKMFHKLCILFFLIKLSQSEYYLNQINHMEYYRNRTRPSKAFSSFSTNYFNQNSLGAMGKGKKVQCGTRTVDFNAKRTGKIVGGTETPYGAFPWQVSNVPGPPSGLRRAILCLATCCKGDGRNNRL